MAEDNFIRWYKSKATDLAQDVPDEVWNSIETKLDLNDVWKGIEDEMDVNDVWTALSHKLDGTHQPASWKKPAAYALLISLLIFLLKPEGGQESPVGDLTRVSTQLQIACAPDVQATETKAQVKAPTSGAHRHPTTPPKIYPSTKSLTTREQNVITASPREEKPPSAVLGLRDPHSLTSARSGNISIPEPVLPVEEEKKYEASAVTEKQPDENKIRERMFYVGAQGTYKNTWLLSPKTFYNLEKQSVNATAITYGKEFGVTAGYFVRPRLAAQVSINSSEDGQRYYEYIDGRHLSTSINLRYTEVTLSARLVQRKFFIFPKLSTSLTGGFFYGFLSNRSNEIALTERALEGYKKCNLGITGGFEHEVRLGNQWAVSGGVLVKYGLINIYEGTATRPAAFNKTSTASVGAQVSLRRYLNKK